jgi:hypothetical protein
MRYPKMTLFRSGFVAVLTGAAWIASLGCQVARADEVMDWNAVAAVQLSGEPPAVELRVMATMHAAMHDAVNSIEPRYRPYGFSIPVHMRASQDAAAASAAHDVLSAMVPAQRRAFDAALARSLAKIPEGRAKQDGTGAGKAVAQAVVAWRAADGFDARVGTVTPFVMKSSAQFSPARCPALADIVKKVQSSEERDVPVWNAAARAASRERNLPMHDNARLFALLYMAAADASLAGPAEPCIISGASEKVLRDLFGSDAMKLDAVRSAMARSSNDASIMLGRKIGSYTVANFLRPVRP